MIVHIKLPDCLEYLTIHESHNHTPLHCTRLDDGECDFKAEYEAIFDYGAEAEADDAIVVVEAEGEFDPDIDSDSETDSIPDTNSGVAGWKVSELESEFEPEPEPGYTVGLYLYYKLLDF